MTSFAVKEHPGYEAEIDNKDNTITMKLPSGANLGSLTAIFAVSDGATVTVDGVEQVSGQTKNDFSQTVTYTLKGKNGRYKKI